MSSHRKPVTRSRGTGRLRAMMSLGAVGFLALGLGAQGTFAFWTDKASANTGTFSSGTLDITLTGALVTAGASPTAPSSLDFGLTNMVPGESRAVAFTIGNAGTVPLNYSVNGIGTGTFAPTLQFTIATGTATNPVQANGLRTGACSGASISGAGKTLATASPGTSLVAGPRSLNANANESICVIASLPMGTVVDNTSQNKTMTAELVFDAKQVGAP